MNCFVDGIGPLPQLLKNAGLWHGRWSVVGITLNAALAGIFLFAIGSTCEWLIRRGEARAP